MTPRPTRKRVALHQPVPQILIDGLDPFENFGLHPISFLSS
jgi:hypothetical protein